MDTDTGFDEVRQLIAQKREGDAVLRMRQISASGDAMARLQCLSTLKVVVDEEASEAVLADLMADLPENQNTLLQIAGALRGMDYPNEAYSIIRSMEQTDPVKRLECLCLQDMEEFESALEVIGSVERTTPYDRILRSETLSAVGEHRMAIEESQSLLSEMPGDFDARRAYVSALMLGGEDKEMVKFVHSCLKEKTAEANALAGYAMRIAGRTKSAAGYATRTLRMDPKNVCAMETLGICLAEKGEYDKARIVAGAINEASPGNKAAINVLSYCPRGSIASQIGASSTSGWRGCSATAPSRTPV